MLSPTRIRVGAALLGVSALLFAAFPLVRPFFPLDPRRPAATLAAAAPAITSVVWVLAHLLATIAFVLLLCSLPSLYACLARSDAEPRGWRALHTSLAGIALILPTLGVETYTLPAVGRVYREGAADVAPLIEYIYVGPTTVVLLAGLSLLAVGALLFAAAIWRSGALSRWAGLILAVGLALWLPLLPPPVRIADGLLIGIGGVWLACSMWREIY